jgi:3-isopropylmalate/(R)-2-methylmalate dehydratase small subunit
MMQPFTVVKGRAACLMNANIDTDVIIRIERLTAGDRTRLGHYALEALRYLPDGAENPGFPFNQSKYRGAPILITGRNFGCGSSREGAVWALMGMGLRCVIAESFGDIFYGNCFQNGILPIRLPGDSIREIAAESTKSDAPFLIDLAECAITTPVGRVIEFHIDKLRREALLSGLDEIALTLRDESKIAAWQAADRQQRPWIWRSGDQ